ncbi:MAG: ArsR/SmtB family transcription factor [Thermoanaerobaculia bacterium]
MATTPLSRIHYVSKALANRARLRVLAILEGRELCVGQVAAILDIARSTASEHLSELRRVGLVSERREGRFVWYSLETAASARVHLDVVLAELSDDPTRRTDQALLARVLSLPHELVCELGRRALETGETRRELTEPDSTALSVLHPTNDPQEDS